MNKIFKNFLILFLLFFSSQISAEEKYSDNEKLNINLDSAKSFLKDQQSKFKSKPDPIEGIWEDERGLYLIYRESDESRFFRMYIIEGYEQSFIDHQGSWEATFFTDVDRKGTYGFYSRVWYTTQSNSYLYETEGGWANINQTGNYLSIEYLEVSKSDVDMDHGIAKIWSVNSISSNKNIEEKTKPQPQKIKPKTKKTYYDFWWVVVLIAGLLFYLYTATVKKPKKIKTKKKTQPKFGIKESLLVFWRGDVSYGISYWVYMNVIGTAISIPAFILTDDQIDNFSDSATLVFILYVIILFVSKFYLIVGTWRSAEKYKALKEKQKESKIWGYLGQVTIVLSVIRGFVEMFR